MVKGPLNPSVAPAGLGPFIEEGQWEGRKGRGTAWKGAGVRGGVKGREGVTLGFLHPEYVCVVPCSLPGAPLDGAPERRRAGLDGMANGGEA